MLLLLVNDIRFIQAGWPQKGQANFVAGYPAESTVRSATFIEGKQTRWRHCHLDVPCFVPRRISI